MKNKKVQNSSTWLVFSAKVLSMQLPGEDYRNNKSDVHGELDSLWNMHARSRNCHKNYHNCKQAHLPEIIANQTSTFYWMQK